MKEEVQNSIHPSVQFLLLIAICIGCMIVGAGIGLAIICIVYNYNTFLQAAAFKTTYPGVINSLWILQITSTTIPLFVGPYVVGRYILSEPKAYLKMTAKISPLLFVLGFIIMFSILPSVELLGAINQKMHFSGNLKWLYDWMRSAEDSAAKETALLLQMTTIWQMLFDLLVIGLLTAIAEEFLFRGLVQTIFTRWTKSMHWGVWIAAIIFSAFHMEFFGFLPRVLLGVVLGYLVAYSGSIWTAVWGHFVNNGSIVVITYFYQQKKVAVNPDGEHFNGYLPYIISALFSVFLFVVYRNIAQSKKTLPG